MVVLIKLLLIIFFCTIDCTLAMLAFYCQQYPALEAPLPKVSRIIDEFLRRDPTEELELRLGSITMGRFTNGVTEDFFDKTLQLVEEFDGFTKQDSSWVQAVDYFYKFKNLSVRSRVNETGPVETIYKEVRERLDIEVLIDREFGLMDLLPSAIRVQVAKEIPVQIGANDDVGMTLTYLRLKQQRHFQYKEFSFEFSKVWTGATFQEADRAFFTKPPTAYEIEIEFVGNSCKTPVQLAVSLLLKILDFLPENATLQ